MGFNIHTIQTKWINHREFNNCTITILESKADNNLPNDQKDLANDQDKPSMNKNMEEDQMEEINLN